MRPIVLFVMVCFTMSAFVTPSDAAIILDQSHELTKFESNAGPFGVVRNVAQTIQVGATGQLSRVEFWGYNTSSDPNAAGTVAFDIRLTEPDGSPVEDDLLILAQVLISSSDTSVLGPGNPPSIGPLLISVDLTPFNLFVQSGNSFTFNFSDSSPGENFSLIVLGDYGPGGGFGPYSSGQAFVRRTDIMNGEFFAWDGGSAEVGPVDLGFRTYVNTDAAAVPEPASLAIWGGIGLIGLVAGWRRRSRQAI